MQASQKELPADQLSSQTDMDLTKITEFNPALIYGFETEISVRATEVKQNDIEPLLHAAGQYQDMYNAYLYAQEVIIPEIKQIGFQALTVDKVILWLEQLHKRMANTLVSDRIKANLKGVVAGECSQRIIIRWHNGADIGNILCQYLSGLAPTNADMTLTLAKMGLEQDTAAQFLKILKKIAKDDSIEIPASEKPFINTASKLYKGTLGINRLVVAYHNKILSRKERMCVDKVIKICALPAEFPKIRHQFATDFISNLRATNPKDNKSIAKLMTFIFEGITGGHWWFNGNGRTATCFMNTILRTLGKPSILVRNPNEKNDANSSYARAISKIDKEPELLLLHLATRLEETEQGNFYHNENESTNVLLRVQLAKAINRVKDEFPSFNIQAFYSSKYSQFCAQSAHLGLGMERAIPFLLQSMLKSINELHAKLVELKTKSFISDLSKGAKTDNVELTENSQSLKP